MNTVKTFTASLALLGLLAACGERDDGQTVGQKIDSAIGRTAEAGREVKEGAQSAAEDARGTVMGAGREVREGTATLGAKAEDAAITARVKTGMSADKNLSAMKIDVDTQAGVVTLKGEVPDATARQRAMEIAKNVKDVKSVNDQLVVKGG